MALCVTRGFLDGSRSNEPAYQCRRHRFNPWVRKSPWGKRWPPTQVFLPGKPHGQRSLAVYSPWGCKESDMSEPARTQRCAALSQCSCLSPALCPRPAGAALETCPRPDCVLAYTPESAGETFTGFPPLHPSRLKEDAKQAIEALGSTEIRNMRFRSSWVFVAAKGFELPAGIQREKVSGC